MPTFSRNPEMKYMMSPVHVYSHMLIRTEDLVVKVVTCIDLSCYPACLTVPGSTGTGINKPKSFGTSQMCIYVPY